MTPRRLLVAVSAAQLAAGLAGLAVAARGGAATTTSAFMRGQSRPRRPGLVLAGTAYSAPVPMLAAQAWATRRLRRGPDDGARRMLGTLGALMVPGYLMERYGRAHLTRPGSTRSRRRSWSRARRWPPRWPCSATGPHPATRRSVELIIGEWLPDHRQPPPHDAAQGGNPTRLGQDGGVIKTPLTRWFDLSTPVIGAPMAGVAGGELARAVSRAAASGMIGVSGAPPRRVRSPSSARSRPRPSCRSASG